MNGASGHTSDGHVEWTWNLTDFNGNLRDDLDFDPFYDPWITFAAAAPGGGQTTRPTPVAVMPYPNVGAWLIAFQYLFDFGTPNYNKLVDGMYGIAGWIDYRNIPENVSPILFGTNAPTTQADRDAGWSRTKGLLSQPDYRNFYYFGHGYTNAIGGDVNAYDASGTIIGAKNLPGSKAFLLSSTVKSDITYNKNTGYHRYRFVWLDGCLTALGDWPAAFGVNTVTNTLASYTNSNTNPQHLRPSAFVGWATKVGGSGWGNYQDFFNCRTEWMKEWSYNWQTKSLIQALEDGRNNSGWVANGTFWGGIRVYGYTVIKMNEFNRKTDWPQ